MAFSIVYKESSVSPYDDWIRRGKPNLFYINYIQSGETSCRFDIVFVPRFKMLSIRACPNGFGVIAKLRVDTAAQRLKIKASTCNWKDQCGGNDLTFKVINSDLLQSIATNIFGKEYTFAPYSGSKKRLQNGHWQAFEFQALRKLLPLKCDRGAWTLLTSYCDVTQEVAATKIQACFRGWRVRMQYRYNPYNCLGRYVILKEGGV